MASLSSAEILGIAKADGTAVLDCESYKEAMSMASALRMWLKYNDKESQYEVTRSKTTIVVSRTKGKGGKK